MQFQGIRGIVYVDDLGDSPAEVNLYSKVCTISKKHWRKLPFESKLFILLHEDAHACGIYSESAADAHAFQRFASAGYSLKKAVHALTKVLTNKTWEHKLRQYEQLSRSYQWNCQHNNVCKPVPINPPSPYHD